MEQYLETSKVNLGDFNSTKGLDRGAGKFKEVMWYFLKVVFFLSALPYPSSLKCSILRAFGAKIGNNVIIKPRVNIHFPWKLFVGNNVWIGEEAFLLNFEKLNIGNNVCISQRAFLCGGNHDYRDLTMTYRNDAITLEDGCWVGASVFVSSGVNIGMDTVVTAGSVVTRSLPSNGVYKGNPVVYIKPRWK